MMTSKERAALRAQANPLEVTLIVGKSGISQTLLDEAVILLDSHELVKGRVLETAGLTAREASDMLCEALGAEGIACVGTKFVIWRKSEKLAQEKKKAMNDMKDDISQIAMELTRAKITVDKLTLRQQEGFLSVLPFGRFHRCPGRCTHCG